MMTIVIQAGGESSRMGQNKALVSFLGKPLIERVIENFTFQGEELLVTTNQPGEMAFLGIRMVPDLLPGRGALGGLLTALDAAHEPLVGVIACDMPFASSTLLARLKSILIDPQWDLAVPYSADGYEPFHAVYRKSVCLAAVQKALDQGKQRMISWFGDVHPYIMGPDELRKYDPNGKVFLNVNTPEELAAAEQEAFQAMRVNQRTYSEK